MMRYKMKYFITTHTIQPKNLLQGAIITEVENWRGTLIEDSCSMEDCILHFKRLIRQINDAFPRSKPCELSRNDHSLSFATKMTDDTFAILTFHEVKYSYDGTTRRKEK
jgi:hypothetical protein